MSKAKKHLKHALDTALLQYAETMGEAFPVVPSLNVIDDPGFWALAEMDGNTLQIRVSSGTVNQTTALWASAFADEIFSASFGQACGADASAMAHISLVWLMLHEMHHFQMGHFRNCTLTNSLNTDVINERGLVTRANKGTLTPSMDVAENSLIVEMQADHDATEMLLDAYSPEEWISLRARIAAISAMMMLIERADARNQPSSPTHPKAATRIFQLIGHLVDMPVLSAHTVANKTNDSQLDISRLASTNEHDRFTSQVIVPAFFDASTLARIACAQSITNDLGSATDFFHDVQIAKLMGAAASDSVTTSGARQWSKLIARNIEMSF